MKSLSEIETVSKRASRAAGYSWGICEEVGKNIRLLEMFGLPGIKNLNDYFDKKKKQKFENLKLINAENKSTKFQYCPIISGTSFLDQIKSLEKLNEIKFVSDFFKLSSKISINKMIENKKYKPPIH